MSAAQTDVFDVAVIGSGFAGSLIAMIAHRLGLSVLLVERGQHPRVVIGESSTPLANLLLEELAHAYDLPQLLPLTKWGTWQRAYPQVGCGLKRGFTFYQHTRGHNRDPRDERERQLLVAASPYDAVADTHWYRAELDCLLVEQARALGVVYVDNLHITCVHREQTGSVLDSERLGEPLRYCARSVLDAAGPRGALHRLLGLGEAALPGMPATQAVFNHFRGVARSADVTEGAPYPPEDAAVHHVFEGGWIWMLHFNNGVTSAGVVLRDDLADELRLCEGAAAWSRLLARYPSLTNVLRAAEPQLPFGYIPRVSFLSDRLVGDGWALLPSAAGFVDPLLSTGIPQTLLGVQRIARILETHRGLNGAEEELAQYAAQTAEELKTTARLVGALYATMGNFPAFSALCLLYFAAVSYAETAKRLGRGKLAQGFLLRENAEFAATMDSLCARAHSLLTGEENSRFAVDVRRLIAPFDVAGLSDATRRSWYPVRAAHALDTAHKLGVSTAEMRAMLARCGMSA